MKLVKTAGLSDTLETACKANIVLGANWVIARKWKEDSRYEPKGWKPESDARDLIEAITQEREGVLPWIRLHW